MESVEAEIMRKVRLRILPWLALAFFCGWLDKANIGFAALEMNADLGLSNTDFGLGAGFFAIGYVLFALPGTLLLKRFGARKWLGLVLILCAFFSGSMAFITSAHELWLVRAMLGMAEASIYPGIIYFIGSWLPDEYRGRAVGAWLLVTPGALAVGGPLSSALFGLDGVLGLAGWQWVFIVEALPTLLVALAILLFLTNRPSDARWLSAAEKHWLEQKLQSESRALPKDEPGRSATSGALSNRRVWFLIIANFAFGICGAGTIFFMPLMVKSIGFSTVNTGLIVTLPAIAGGLALPLWGHWTDRARRREKVLAAAGCVGAAGLFAAAMLLPSPLALIGFAVAMAGLFGTLVPIAILPYAFLSGAAVAAAIATINVASNLGQFGGSYLVGWLSDLTGNYVASLAALGTIAVLAAGVVVISVAASSPSGRSALERARGE